MPVPDPVPSPGHSARQRFWKVLHLLALFAIAIAALAVVLVSRGDPRPLGHIPMLLATAVGVGLTVFVGTVLMTLMFMSNSSGHDEAAAKFHEESEKNDRS